jgi:hypothetical protein
MERRHAENRANCSLAAIFDPPGDSSPLGIALESGDGHAQRIA